MSSLFAIPAFLFLGLFWVFPLTKVVALTLSSDIETSVFLKDELFWRTFLFTYGQAFLSALLSAALGTLGAWVYSEYRFTGRQLFWRSNLLFFSLPTLIGVMAITSFWGRSGVGGWIPGFSLYGLFGILAGHVFFNAPLFVKWVGIALSERDRRPEMAAATLGANPQQVFVKVIFPMVRPAFTSAFAMAFLLSSSSFLIVMLLGGGPRFQTLELAVYESIKMNLNLPIAVRLATVQLIVSLIVYALFLSSKAPQSTDGAQTALRAREGKAIPIAFLVLYFFVCVGPLGLWVLTSWEGFRSMDFPALWEAIRVSVSLAFSVAIFSVLLALGAAYGLRHSRSAKFQHFVSFSMGLPVSLSAIILSFALLVTWKENLAGYWAGIPIVLVQTLLALPFVFRVLKDGFERIEDPLYRSAAMLGAGPVHTFCRVELPLLRAPVTAAFLTAVGFSLGEVGAVLVFYSKQTTTLALRIEELMSVYRFNEAFSVGVVLLAATVLLFFGMERWTDSK